MPRIIDPPEKRAAAREAAGASGPRYLTITEAAKLVAVDRRTLQNWCRGGKVPGAMQTPGGHWRVPEAWATAGVGRGAAPLAS